MKLRREILAIAIPAIVTNITTPMLSLVDTAVTGHIGEADYIAAIALGGTLFNAVYWLFNFLRMGTTGLTAQAYGRGSGTPAVLWQSIAVSIISGVALTAAIALCNGSMLRLIDAGGASVFLAWRYVRIVLWGAPAVLGTYAATGWLVGMQNTLATMAIAIATNIINIAVSCFLVFAMGWTIEGVATGTLVAQWCGLAIALSMIWHKYRPYPPKGWRAPAVKEMRRFFSINIDIFLRTACLVAVTLWFTHAGASAGVGVLAANTLLLQLFMLFSFFMDGFAYAAEALAGKYYGMANGTMLRKVIRHLNITGIVCALLFAVLYMFAGKHIIGLLTNQHDVLGIARQYLVWTTVMPLCGYLAFVYDGILVGLTRTRIMLAAMALAMVIFFALYFVLEPRLGNHGLWIAFEAYLVTRGVTERLRLRRHIAVI